MRSRGPAETLLQNVAKGLAALIPGVSQFVRGDSVRGVICISSYMSGLFLLLFSWGTLLGFVGAFFCVAVHVASLADTISSRTFPQVALWRSGWVSLLVVSILMYIPILVCFSAWFTPGWTSPVASLLSSPTQGYLLNRRVFENRRPVEAEWVWLRGEGRRPAQLGFVVGVEGQEIEWSNQILRVDGHAVSHKSQIQPNLSISALHFTVPPRHLLVATNVTRSPVVANSDWMLVPEDAIEGRVSAQMYPIWERRLLL